VVDSADALVWSWTPHGHDALWMLASTAYEALLGIGPGGPGVALTAVRQRRARRFLAERGLDLGVWAPGHLRVALDAAVSTEARDRHAVAVEARAVAVAARRESVARAQAARGRVGAILEAVGSPPRSDAPAECLAWMTLVRDARPHGDDDDRAALARRLKSRGWAGAREAALDLLPDAEPEEVDLARRQARLVVIKQALQSRPSGAPGWLTGAQERMRVAGVGGHGDQVLLARYLAGALRLSQDEAKAWAVRIVGDDDQAVAQAS
ncbi:MAG: hypothetical protein ACR2NJ_01495, partial [Acidimicrobiales bacterium]